MQNGTIRLPVLPGKKKKKKKTSTPFTASLCPQPVDLPWTRLRNLQNVFPSYPQENKFPRT